jgi:archaellum component FlaG (FlaF/FlaG flagellin family)
MFRSERPKISREHLVWTRPEAEQASGIKEKTEILSDPSPINYTSQSETETWGFAIDCTLKGSVDSLFV